MSCGAGKFLRGVLVGSVAPEPLALNEAVSEPLGALGLLPMEVGSVDETHALDEADTLKSALCRKQPLIHAESRVDSPQKLVDFGSQG